MMDTCHILWEAVKGNDIETVNMILHPSAGNAITDVNSKNVEYTNNGVRPIHLAIINNNNEILDILRKSNAELSEFSVKDVLSYLPSRIIPNDIAKERLSLLCLPILMGNTRMLYHLIDCGVKPTNDSLSVSCHLGEVSILRRLLSTGGSQLLENYKQSCDIPLLVRIASINNVDLDVVKVILDQDVSLQDLDFGGNTALHIAVNSQNKELVQLIFEEMQRTHQPVCVLNNNGYSPMHIACHSGKLEVLQMLMEHSCSRQCNVQGKTCLLHSAAKTGHADIVQYLLQNQNESVNALDNFANTPLSQAVVKANNVEVARLLLEAGADPSIPKPPYYNIIISAAQKGSLEMVSNLLKYGANANSIDILGYAPISYASSRRDNPGDFIHVLMMHGADIGHRHGDGSTVLHRAVAEDNLPAITSLIQHEADISSLNRIGKLPLHFVISKESAKILLDHGAGLDVPDQLSYTPLMSACRHRNVEVAQYLISRGADINASNNEWVSPLSLAIGNNLTVIVRELILADVKDVSCINSWDLSSTLELALCLDASREICDMLHNNGSYIRSTFSEESTTTYSDNFMQIQLQLGVYKRNVHNCTWKTFVAELAEKYDLVHYRSPIRLQAECGRFLRRYFNSNTILIKQLPLPGTILNGVLLKIN